MNTRLFFLLLTLIFLTNAKQSDYYQKRSDLKLKGLNEKEQISHLMHFVFGTQRSKSATEKEFLKCATPLLRDYEQLKQLFSAEEQAEISSFLSLSSADKTFTSPSGKFLFTYSTDGSNAVPSKDSDNDGVPDFVENTAKYMDESYQVEVTEEGYKDPINFGKTYPVSFRSMGSYGITQTSGDSTIIVLHNTFSGFPPNTDPDGQVLGAAKVTCAHEFKHAIQFKTDHWSSNWEELDATWAEELVYDETNDYYNYLSNSSCQLTNPTQSIFNGGGGSYHDVIWQIYLQEKFGKAILRDLWKRRESNTEPYLTSTDSAIAGRGGNLEDAIGEYFTYNFFTGNRAVGTYGYSEQNNYPTSVTQQVFSVNDSVKSSAQPFAAYQVLLDFGTLTKPKLTVNRFNEHLHVYFVYKLKNSSVGYVERIGNTETSFSYYLNQAASAYEFAGLVFANTNTSGGGLTFSASLNEDTDGVWVTRKLNDINVFENAPPLKIYVGDVFAYGKNGTDSLELSIISSLDTDLFKLGLNATKDSLLIEMKLNQFGTDTIILKGLYKSFEATVFVPIEIISLRPTIVSILPNISIFSSQKQTRNLFNYFSTTDSLPDSLKFRVISAPNIVSYYFQPKNILNIETNTIDDGFATIVVEASYFSRTVEQSFDILIIGSKPLLREEYPEVTIYSSIEDTTIYIGSYFTTNDKKDDELTFEILSKPDFINAKIGFGNQLYIENRDKNNGEGVIDIQAVYNSKAVRSFLKLKILDDISPILSVKKSDAYKKEGTYTFVIQSNEKLQLPIIKTSHGKTVTDIREEKENLFVAHYPVSESQNVTFTVSSKDYAENETISVFNAQINVVGVAVEQTISNPNFTLSIPAETFSHASIIEISEDTLTSFLHDSLKLQSAIYFVHSSVSELQKPVTLAFHFLGAVDNPKKVSLYRQNVSGVWEEIPSEGNLQNVVITELTKDLHGRYALLYNASKTVFLPETFVLQQNFPNPFNPGTTIPFELESKQLVRVIIYNILGQPVKVYEPTFYTQGRHSVYWGSINDRGQSVSAGIYFYQIITEKHQKTKRMVLLK